MVDYVKAVRERQEISLQDRLAEYESSILLMSHSGDVPSMDGFNVGKVRTFADLFALASPAIAIMDNEALDLARAIGVQPTVVGLNVLLLVEVPGQEQDAYITSELSQLRRVNFVQMLNDLADMRLREEHMTEQERALSKTKEQESRLKRKDGTVRRSHYLEQRSEDDVVDAV